MISCICHPDFAALDACCRVLCEVKIYVLIIQVCCCKGWHGVALQLFRIVEWRPIRVLREVLGQAFEFSERRVVFKERGADGFGGEVEWCGSVVCLCLKFWCCGDGTFSGPVGGFASTTA
jgi:hypothetical protein